MEGLGESGPLEEDSGDRKRRQGERRRKQLESGSLVWCYAPVIPALRRKLKDPEFETLSQNKQKSPEAAKARVRTSIGMAISALYR